MISKNRILTLRGNGERWGAEEEMLESLIAEVRAAMGLAAQLYAPVMLDLDRIGRLHAALETDTSARRPCRLFI
jgi:hypothetical protein